MNIQIDEVPAGIVANAKDAFRDNGTELPQVWKLTKFGEHKQTLLRAESLDFVVTYHIGDGVGPLSGNGWSEIEVQHLVDRAD